MKNRKQRQEEYERKYSSIPSDYNERIRWMNDRYHLTDNDRQMIMNRAYNMVNNMQFNDLFIVLYMVPMSTMRHRYRLITPKNYMKAARSNTYVHVYQPMANDDHNYLRKLVDSELIELEQFIQTPFACNINAFFPTPSSYNRSDKFIAEMGLDVVLSKPDVDNIEKHYLDMFNSTIWLDDNMCFSGRLNKFYSIKPRVEISIRYLNCAMNKHQYDHITSRVGYKIEEGIYYLNKLGLPEGDNNNGTAY